MVQGGGCYLSGKANCLRIPYSSSSKEDQGGGSSITDVKSGTVRRLIAPQGQCGQPQYMGPVMLANTEGFDAHATDLWSAGIILFHMLFGVPSFALANNDDPRFLPSVPRVSWQNAPRHGSRKIWRKRNRAQAQMVAVLRLATTPLICSNPC